MTTLENSISTESSTVESCGLHTGVLGPLETLAQSISSMAPSTSPSLTIPLVFALAGDATWFVYLLATITTLLVGYCVSRFARLSASPGSLYSYAAHSLSERWAAVSAWSLLLAYLATAVSVAGGALYYARDLSLEFLHWAPPALPVLILVCALSAWVAFQDVQISTRLMLWIEAISIGLILVVLCILPFHIGLHIDWSQFRLQHLQMGSLGPALVLAMFSFVGFESATALGAEVKNPLVTIPRAVLRVGILAGAFFMLASYSEVVGFRGSASPLSESTSPLHLLATKAGVSPLGIGIDIGAAVSMFACVLACINAASRVMIRMARGGILPTALQATHPVHKTPGRALLLCSVLVFLPTAILTLRGATGSDIYDWAGSLAVFGFLMAYALVAAGLPFATRSRGALSAKRVVLSLLTILVLALVALFDLRSAADPIHGRIPWLYCLCLGLGMLWFAIYRRYTGAKRS